MEVDHFSIELDATSTKIFSFLFMPQHQILIACKKDMWKTVPKRDARFCRRVSHKQANDEGSSSQAIRAAESSGPSKGVCEVEVSTVANIVKKMRRELLKGKGQYESWSQQAIKCISQRIIERVVASASQLVVCYAVGVGALSNEHSQLQLALFFAVVSQLKEQRHFLVQCVFCDPLLAADSVEAKLCSRFETKFESENKRGAYSVLPAAVSFVFMPHCSRWLYHNLFVANWPTSVKEAAAAELAPSHPLHRLVLVGNDFSKYVDMQQSAPISALLPFLQLQELNARCSTYHDLAVSDTVVCTLPTDVDAFHLCATVNNPTLRSSGTDFI